MGKFILISVVFFWFLFLSFPQHSLAASPDWVVTMYRWDDMSGVMPRTGTINTGESVTIRYNLEGSPKNSSGLFYNVTCVVSDSAGGSWVFSGQPNTVNSQLMGQQFVYYPNQNTTYSFRCQLENDATDFAESTPPIVITVNGGSGGGGFVCTGTPPWVISSYTDIYPGDGDQAALTADTPWQFAPSNTNRLCEFHCKPGSDWIMGRNGYTCTPPGGGDGDPVGDPTANASLVASATSVSPGRSVTLNWNTQGTTSCTINAIVVTATGSSYSVPEFPRTFPVAQSGTAGQLQAIPEAESTNYSISCLDTQNVYHNSLPWNVRVIDSPQIDFYVKSGMETINAGQSSVLQWTVSSVSRGCTLYKSAAAFGNELGETISESHNNLTGEYTVSPTTTTDYILRCSQGLATPPFEITMQKTARVTVNDAGNGGGIGGIGSSAATCSSPNTCTSSCDVSNRVGLCSGGSYCCSPSSTPPPAVFTTPFTFGNPVAFSTVDGLFSRILSFLQATIVLLSLIMIIIGAFLYITSAGDEGRMTQGKKAILAALIGLALGIAAPAFLREIASILGWGTPNLPSGVGTSLTLIQIATNVLNFLLTIIGILAIIMLVIGGIMYLTAAGNEDTLDKGKKIVKYSLIGITIALASLVLVKAVAGLLG